MTLLTRLISAVFTILFFLTLATNAQVANTPTAPTTKVTEIARDLSFRPLVGETQIRMSDYENQTMIIVLWASWCPPCRLALTELTALKRDSFSKTPFPIVALSIEDPAKAEAELKHAVDIISFKEPVGWIDEKAPLVEGRNSIPQVLVVKNLKVLRRFIGWHPRNVGEIRKLLATSLKTSK